MSDTPVLGGLLMTPTLALTLILIPLVALCQPASYTGTVVESYPGSIAVLTPDGTIVRASAPVADTPAYLWDGTPIFLPEVRPGDRVRVDVEGEYLSAYAAGTAIRVVVGPPEDGPDVAFVVAQEAWVAGQDAETRWLVRNLGSRSWLVRERATRELWGRATEAGGAGRLGVAGALVWGMEVGRKGDVEMGERAGGLMREMWITGWEVAR